MPSGEDARTRLLDAAEELFAERGLDAVSLREIHTASGTRNASAIQYHFGDRAGLVTAVLQRHAPGVQARSAALLDQIEADGADDLRVLAGALVRPLAAVLDEPGGSGFLRVLADLLNSPRPLVDLAPAWDASGAYLRWRELVAPLLDADALQHHRRFLALRFTVNELARRSHLDDRRDHRLFTADLVDLVSGLLGAPTSDETRRAARHRPGRRINRS